MDLKHGQSSLRIKKKKKKCYQQKWFSGDDRPELQEWKKGQLRNKSKYGL